MLLAVDAAGDLARIARALGDPVRMQIVDTLRRAAPGTVCVCELTPLFGISQPAVSRHLRVLREAGVVDVERRGPWAHYSIAPGTSLSLLTEWLAR